MSGVAVAPRQDERALTWSNKRIFGFPLCMADAATIAHAVATQRRTPREGVGLIVTPNINHIAQLRRDHEFMRAYERAEIIVCDGFPLSAYARMRGIGAKRVTGTDIAAALMREAVIAPWHRLFFMVDSATTAAAVGRWAERRGLRRQVATAVPPFGFEKDLGIGMELARKVREHGTTILAMGVGAPQSEIFANTHRAALPPCWALCVGQAIKIEAGLLRRAPSLVQNWHGEWLWRIVQEPRRLTGRYARAVGAYLAAVVEDLLGREPITEHRRSLHKPASKTPGVSPGSRPEPGG